MLQPNRTKYRKDQKGRNYGLAQRGANVSFGEFGLKVVERGRLTACLLYTSPSPRDTR